MNNELFKLIKDNNIVIPIYLLKNYKEFKFSLEDFIFFMYLYNEKMTTFNPKIISEDLNITTKEVMMNISSLTEKNIIEIKPIKNKDGVMEDYIDLEPFYNKLSLFISDKSNTEEESSNVYEMIEKEFGRTLSPIEYEIIKAWIDSKISEELIVEAVKEATFNGVSNLRYIDKILYEWKKAGIKSAKDVDKRRKEFKNKKETNSNVELFDYDWFDDEDE